MKFLTLLVVCLSLPFTEVSANNNAVGFEVLFYHYVYKMQYISGGELTVATGCRPAGGGGGSCFFDDFVKHIMEDDFVQGYQPESEDHTKTPTGSNLVAFNKVALPSTSYYLGKLNTVFTGLKLMSTVFGAMLNSANRAISTGNVLTSDAETAVKMVQQVINNRRPQAFQSQLGIMSSNVVEAAQEYVDVDHDTNEFDWDQTFQNIDNDVNSGIINPDTAKAYKDSILNFGTIIGTQADTSKTWDREHVAIMRQLQISINPLNEAISRANGENAIPAKDLLPECASDTESSTGSDSSASSDAVVERRKVSVARMYWVAEILKRPLSTFHFADLSKMQVLTVGFGIE